jgi:endonuclease/exonuclease/phosphatase family metal-dependent hydrolase
MRSVVAVALGAALLAGCGGHALAQERSAGPAFTLLQMNLCLSGLAECYGRVAYPAVVEEAEARIRQIRPDAVTFNEACEGDADRIARQTGYRVRFSRVVYGGKLLPCVSPGGRGLFGDAVLTRAAVARAESREFAVQAGLERRRWLCVATRPGAEVCTAHLAARSGVERPANDAQCGELKALLARRAESRTVIFGGDVNRRAPCAPRALWVRTDAAARQARGIQHVYASRALGSPAVQVLPAAHTDHDVLVVRARRP